MENGSAEVGDGGKSENLLSGYMSKSRGDKKDVLYQIFFGKGGKTKDEVEHDAVRDAVNNAFKSRNQINPFFEIMLDAMADAGCAVDPASNVIVKKCEMEDMLGAFNKERNQIEICQDTFNAANYPDKIKAIQITLSHTLVHAFDHCRANSEAGDIHHDMCSSIRAAALSGQCTSEAQLRSTAQLLSQERGYQTCVTNNALLSFLSRHQDWSADKAYSLLEKVYPTCFFDHAPHDRLPYNNRQAELSYKAYLTRNRYTV